MQMAVFSKFPLLTITVTLSTTFDCTNLLMSYIYKNHVPRSYIRKMQCTVSSL